MPFDICPKMFFKRRLYEGSVSNLSGDSLGALQGFVGRLVQDLLALRLKNFEVCGLKASLIHSFLCIKAYINKKELFLSLFSCSLSSYIETTCIRQPQNLVCTNVLVYLLIVAFELALISLSKYDLSFVRRLACQPNVASMHHTVLLRDLLAHDRWYQSLVIK